MQHGGNVASTMWLHAFAVQMIGLLCSRRLSLAVLFVLIIHASSTPPAPTAPTASFIPAAPDATRQSKAGEAAALDLLADAQQMASQALEWVYEADAHIRAMMSHGFPGLTALNTYIVQRKQQHERLIALSAADQHALFSLEELLLAAVQNMSLTSGKSLAEGHHSSVQDLVNSRRRQGAACMHTHASTCSRVRETCAPSLQNKSVHGHTDLDTDLHMHMRKFTHTCTHARAHRHVHAHVSRHARA